MFGHELHVGCAHAPPRKRSKQRALLLPLKSLPQDKAGVVGWKRDPFARGTSIAAPITPRYPWLPDLPSPPLSAQGAKGAQGSDAVSVNLTVAQPHPAVQTLPHSDAPASAVLAAAPG
jgi:hypothetical protein